MSDFRHDDQSSCCWSHSGVVGMLLLGVHPRLPLPSQWVVEQMSWVGDVPKSTKPTKKADGIDSNPGHDLMGIGSLLISMSDGRANVRLCSR